MSNYLINISFNSAVERTPRVLEIAEGFGLGINDTEFTIYKDLNIEVGQGDIMYITGQSGSGKSQLLKELRRQMRDEGRFLQDLDDIVLLDKPIIEQIGASLSEGMKFLSYAGINDAYLLIRKPHELSDGQRYRFKLAKLIESGATVWTADEFTAMLDRNTAKVVAFNMAKVARKAGATLIVATTHMDLKADINPDIYVEKYFKEKLHIEVATHE